MFLHLVTRNTVRNLPRLTPLAITIVAVFAALFVGNAVLTATGRSLYQTYARLVAGDMSVGAGGRNNFTVFGSDQFLVGELITAGTLADFHDLRNAVRENRSVRSTAGLVSASARVTINGTARNRVVFGVDFPDYQSLFPDLELVAGTVPAPGQPGIVVQASRGVPDDLIGKPALLASRSDGTFTLREVTITGLFRYPVEDELLSNVVLTDADTARALNGYLYGALESTELTQEETDVFSVDVDDLFSRDQTAHASDVPAADGSGVVLDIGALVGGNSSDMSSVSEFNAARQAVAGTYNFLLIGLDDWRNRRRMERDLKRAGFDGDAGYRIKAWWETVGGNASLVRYLQIIFNAGLFFVALGAAIVTTNAIALSVLERTAEIGTLRALGASRGRVSLMVAMETFLIVVGAALIGIVVGAIATRAINGAGYVVQNRYIQILFGGEPLRGFVSGALVARHLVGAVFLSVVAILYPTKRTLQISPREAMVS